jgi:predicted DNA-binding transcriptional regulator AlpA
MEPFNFNELPDVVRRLFEKVERMETLLINLQPKDVSESDLLDITEAAKFLKVSVASLYTKVSRNQIPVSKPGKRLYFIWSELRECIKTGREKSSFEISAETNNQNARSRIRLNHKLDKFG